MQKILLVDDSPDFQLIVRKVLDQRGYRIVTAANVADALKELSKEDFDLILLDIGLPDRDGFELCMQLQNDSRTRGVPVIFLTAKSEVTDKVTAFSLGAEDYIVKPFDPLEFRARIEAKLARAKRKTTGDETYRVGPLEIQPGLHRVIVKRENSPETEVALTPLEFKILYHLSRNKDQVFTRDQLLTAVWGQNVHVYGRTVDAHICTLRKKMGDLSKCVESVPGVGYRFSLAACKRERSAA